METIKRKFKKTGMRMLLSLLLSVVVAVSSMTVIASENMDNVAEENVGKNTDHLQAPVNVNKKGYDVVYVVDNSRSVWKQQEIRNHALRNISSMAVWSDIRIGGVFFADHVYDTLSLTSVEDENGAQKVLDFLDMTVQDEENIDTNIGNALEAALQLFDSQDSSRERIIILFSDGINENLDGSRAYARSANEKTEEQVQILKEDNIPIYCVFLQKDRNDEKYLKNLVNYFSDEYSYVDERFFKVPEEEISILSDTFVNVFHTMQNDMKYRQVNLDSTGTMKFYVPSLGINQLKIYMEGNLTDGGVYPPVEKENKSLAVGSSLYMLYENPDVGEWSIEVPSREANGTVTYYANLLADAELELVGNNQKERQYQIVVRFYDELGNEISIDPMISTNAKFRFTSEEGEETLLDLQMAVEDGKAKSEPFILDSYGSYDFDIHVEYEDFVNLDYTMPSGKIERQAPVVYHKADTVFLSEKTEQGYVFSMEESRLFIDREGDAVAIENVVQLLEGNPVTVEHANGYVKMTVPNKGKIHCALQLKDTSGMETEVTVQGKVRDIKIMTMIATLIKAALAIVAILIVLLVLGKMKKKTKLKDNVKLFGKYKRMFSEKIAAFYEEAKEIPELIEAFEYLFAGDKDLVGLSDLAAGMPEELQAVYGIQEYLAPDFISDSMKPAKALVDQIARMEAGVGRLLEQMDNIEISKESINKKNAKAEQIVEAIRGYLDEVPKCTERLKTCNCNADALIDKINDTINEMLLLMAGKIQCNLSVTDIAGKPYMQGYTRCRQMNGNIQGYYKLDDVNILGRTNLADEIGETGIYVFSYKADDGDCGLELRGTRKFEVLGTKMKNFGSQGVCAVLMSGNKYILKLANGTSMTLEVEK